MIVAPQQQWLEVLGALTWDTMAKETALQAPIWQLWKSIVLTKHVLYVFLSSDAVVNITVCLGFTYPGWWCCQTAALHLVNADETRVNGPLSNRSLHGTAGFTAYTCNERLWSHSPVPLVLVMLVLYQSMQ